MIRKERGKGENGGGKGEGRKIGRDGKTEVIALRKIARGFQIADLLTIETDLRLKINILYSIFMLKKW